MKIKGIQLIKLGNSQGFLVPVQHTEERLEGGLVLGQKYDLDISEAE